jgi:hypothetical protein
MDKDCDGNRGNVFFGIKAIAGLFRRDIHFFALEKSELPLFALSCFSLSILILVRIFKLKIIFSLSTTLDFQN